jgi:hypothetical protein
VVDGDGDGLTVVVAGVGVVACVLGCVVVAVADWLVDADEVAVPDEADVDDPAVPADPDEKIAGTLDDGVPVQAETAAETRTIKVAHHSTVSRGLLTVLAEVMRTFISPPQMPGSGVVVPRP